MRSDDETPGTIPHVGQCSVPSDLADRLIARRRAAVIAAAGLAMVGALGLTIAWVLLAVSMSTLWWWLVVLVLIVIGIVGAATTRPVPRAGPWPTAARDDGHSGTGRSDIDLAR